MTGGAAPALIADPETRRALRLDALAAILPVGPLTGLRSSLPTPTSRQQRLQSATTFLRQAFGFA
jgi:hypothetical protein